MTWECVNNDSHLITWRKISHVNLPSNKHKSLVFTPHQCPFCRFIEIVKETTSKTNILFYLPSHSDVTELHTAITVSNVVKNFTQLSSWLSEEEEEAERASRGKTNFFTIQSISENKMSFFLSSRFLEASPIYLSIAWESIKILWLLYGG